MTRRRSVLSSRTSRAALPPSDAPEWEIVSRASALATAAGEDAWPRRTWLAATRAIDGIRVQTRLGRADDLVTAESALTHEQAKDAARAWAERCEPVGR